MKDINQEQAGMETARLIEQKGRRALFVPCDVSKAQDVKETMRRTIETFGKLDYAFNNAGIEGKQAPTPDCTEENWARVIDVNLKGVCSSIAGLIGFPGIPAYVASKGHSRAIDGGWVAQ